ncbi:hypothetical protein ROHU_033131 [Labeo rohita]|uniref:Uncharacterized protein n=1 Tax=Labeo rohita TaxID=84645 RepID=A0A498LCI5_LABRO|nr:hypothetical protein ROHU_033131 [Labeo rohita]
MDNKKRKGGAEKARIKKKKALETDTAKCTKLSTFFVKTSGSESTTTHEDDETAALQQQQQPLVQFAANSEEPGPVTLPSTSHEPNTLEWAVSDAEPGPSCIMQETVENTGYRALNYKYYKYYK